MLIQITNRCHMGCPHCMQNSVPSGSHMSEETFEKVLDFCREVSPIVVNVTGGEPTEHPRWDGIVRELAAVKGVTLVIILTNGAWIDDDEQRLKMARLIRDCKGHVKVQVYSHPKYYRDHEWTVEHEARFKSIGCTPDFKSPIFMQDLGRARKNCQKEIAASDFVPSCINTHLIALQSSSMKQFFQLCIQLARVCRPLVDIEGNIHMSESWLCQSVANVSDGADTVFSKMRESRPCKGCRLYKNFAALHANEMKVLE